MAERRTTSDDVATPPLFGFLAALFVGLVVVLGAVWLLIGALEPLLAADDPPPWPMDAANERRLPPSPRLQVDPRRDLRALREAEETWLTSYGRTDDGAAHVPIERAIEILVEEGVR